jgi:molybdopterin/thiamine biosynthesis adenylyltransferase
MAVLDLIAREPQLTHVTLVEPDVFKPHNVERHLFPATDTGAFKAEAATRWLHDRRPDLTVHAIIADLLDPERQAEFENLIAMADIGVCAADNEPAKYHFDSLMRRFGKPWTLGEVLAGGIGGFVHWFRPGGPCYGCVASHLGRSVEVEKPRAPDYSNPGANVVETTVPASRASIGAIAGLHALVTLELLANPTEFDPGFSSLLVSLKRVPDIFAEPFRPHRFRVARSPECLICGSASPVGPTSTPEDLDVALDQALARLGHE